MDSKKAATIAAYENSAQKLAHKFDTQGARIEDIVEIFHALQKENPFIVEIGCGNGQDAQEILKQTNRYLGLDVAPTMIKLAKEKNPNGDFAVADIENYELPNNIDAIAAFASLIHVPELSMRKIIDEAYEHLNPNGILFLSLKHGEEYSEVTKEDEFGTRTFYLYSDKDIRTMAEGKFEVKKLRIHELRGQIWMKIMLQKLP